MQALLRARFRCCLHDRHRSRHRASECVGHGDQACGSVSACPLHQLRGRVGRDRYQSHCILLYQYPISKLGKARLNALAETANGFEIAERDLQLRGPGDFFGTRQSGLPTLRTGDLLRDHMLMEQARDEASAFLEQRGPTEPVVAMLKQTWPSRFGLMDIG